MRIVGLLARAKIGKRVAYFLTVLLATSAVVLLPLRAAHAGPVRHLPAAANSAAGLALSTQMRTGLGVGAALAVIGGIALILLTHRRP